MSKQGNVLYRAFGMFAWVALLSVIGAMYRAATKHDVPIFSLDALVLEWPTWCGGFIGASLFAAVWYLRNRSGQHDA
jgi:hypothetical protein